MFKLDTLNPLGYFKPIVKSALRILCNERGEVAPVIPVVDPPVEPPVTNWRDSLPDDIKADPVFEKYKDANDAHKALVGAQKFLGRESLPVPIDENDEDAHSLILKRLGAPETADKYEVPTDLEIPKDLPLDDNMLQGFKEVAHKHGVLPKQFAAMYKFYMETVSGQYKQMNEQNETEYKEAETNQRKTWGAAYNQKISLAQKVISSFATEQEVNELAKGPGNNPILLGLFSKIGEAMSEDMLAGKPPSLTDTPSEAQEKLKEIEGNLKHPYWNADHPGHQAAVEEFTRLTKLSIVGQ